jgi:predicted transglutaminase-like cysteine proteinase
MNMLTSRLLSLVKALLFVVFLQQWPAYALDQMEAQNNPEQGVHAGASAQTGLASLSPPNADEASGEPFGFSSAVPVKAGELAKKWQRVTREIKSEAALLSRCLDYQDCSVTARKFLEIIAEGREHDGLARVGRINRAINLSIAPTSDMKQWGNSDHWSAPLETLAAGRGDCEDYAIAKYVALLAAGVAEQDVKIVVARAREEEHAVVTVRLAGSWIVLDNRWLALVADVEVKHMTPEFVIDHSGVKAFSQTEMASLSGSHQSGAKEELSHSN